MLNMLVAYVHLGTYLKATGHYPDHITAAEARRNGWICVTDKSAYDYVLPGVRVPPVLIDLNPHVSGYIVVYGEDSIAVIPDEDYATFRAELKRGNLNIRSSWKKAGAALHDREIGNQ